MHRSIFVFATAIVLVSCNAASNIEPNEVLRKSVIANQELESARFDMDAAFAQPLTQSVTALAGSIKAKGVIQEGGTQMEFSLLAEANATQESQWKVAADFIIVSESEIFARLTHVDSGNIQEFSILSFMTPLLDTWWQLPVADTSAQSQVTPDPRFLGMQAEIVDVTEDRGFDTVNDRTSHHYAVTLNKEKLTGLLLELSKDKPDSPSESDIRATVEQITATGELWIDRETYALTKMQWHITPTVEQPYDIKFTAVITDHGIEVTIQPPEGSALLPISPGLFLSPPAQVPTGTGAPSF